MIEITQQELNELIKFANEIPTRFGLPLLQFFESKKPEEVIQPNDQTVN